MTAQETYLSTGKIAGEHIKPKAHAMSSASPHLLSPFDLHGLSLKNRVVMAPMTRARAGIERMPNALMVEYYRQRASAGLIVTEATVVSEQGIGWLNTPGLYSDVQGEAWKPVVAAVHGEGGKIFAQLWHTGRASHSSFHAGKLPVSASANKINADGIHTPTGKHNHEVPRALETDEIPGVVEDYRRAAARAKAAGFDGIELHAANGYLIDQFLQSKSNQRTDQYGGSIENRTRFLEEIVEAVCTVWPADRVGVRLSPNGIYNDMGSPDYRELFLHAASQMNVLKIGYLHIMDGLTHGFHEFGEPMTLAEFRQQFDGALIGNCGYTQESAEAAIAAGHGDMIAFGADYISNPDMVERFTNGWPLSEQAPMDVWFSFDEKGYTDFPNYRSE